MVDCTHILAKVTALVSHKKACYFDARVAGDWFIVTTAAKQITISLESYSEDDACHIVEQSITTMRAILPQQGLLF